MKTNLKKAISAVSALALAGSVVPASFAAKLTLKDVADTASYATAVNTLVALKVINGYEDGTFLPDNLITRAEATKIMVAALNQLDSAESMKGSTKFTDVEAKHEWATGFINAGVQAGYINGMGDGTFAPDANVTYAQMVKMLVSAMGYDAYADFMGGYPNGYIAIANSEGVADGVKSNADDKVTRAQVAQLVYNALLAPIVDNVGITYTDSGAIRPDVKKMDGTTTDRPYKSLLTEKFDAYYVEGYVTETSKSAGSNLKSDEVKFQIAKSKKYDNDEFSLEKSYTDIDKAKADGKEVNPVKVADTDAADFEGSYATAIIRVDEYDDKSFVSFQPSGKNKTFKFDVSLVDDDAYKGTGKAFTDIKDTDLKVFASDSATKSTKYSLQNDKGVLKVDVYVNGSKLKLANADEMRAAIQTYVIDASVGEVELVDTYKTDGYYDTIYVSNYITAKVDSVDKTKLRFADSVPTGLAVIDLDTEKNDKLVYNIYYNGEKISLNEVKKNDIVSIAYNVSDAKGKPVDNCKSADHFDIYVSRNVQTGKCNAKSDSNENVNIGGTVYEFVTSSDRTYADASKTLRLSDEYTIYLDNFNRIYDYEKNTSAAKYAIIDKFTKSSSDDDYRAYLFTADGEKKNILFDGNLVDADGKVLAKGDAADTQIIDKVYTGKTVDNTKRTTVENRVIKYKVSSRTGYISEIEFLTGTKSDSNYKLSSGSIGSVKLDESTKVIDSINYSTKLREGSTGYKYDSSDLSIASKGSLQDSQKYVAYGFDKIDGYHQLVIVTEGVASYNEDTRFAVVTDGTGTETTEQGDDVVTIPAFWYNTAEGADNSKEISLLADADLSGVKNLQAGDVIIFTLDSDNIIDKYKVIFNFNKTDLTDYNTFTLAALENTDKTNLPEFGGRIDYPLTDDSSDNWVKAWDKKAASTAGETSVDDAVQLVFGPIMDKNSDKSFTIGKIGASKSFTDTDDKTKTYTGRYTILDADEKADGGVYEIDLARDVAVYTYDFGASKKNRLEIGSAASIVKSSFVSSTLLNDKNLITWDVTEKDKDGKDTYPNQTNVNFAFAKVVDGVATDVVVFLAE